MNASDDERYTLTGSSQWRITGTCVLCGFKTLTGYSYGARKEITDHLATHHPTRTPVTLPADDEIAGFVRVATCEAGRTYDALPGGADAGLFDTWYEAHRHHTKESER